MKKIFILAFILSTINGICQTPFPVDNHILVDMKPVKIDDIPVIDEAEMDFDIIETEQEEETEPENRVVYWIHGLGGDGTSWSKAAQASMYQSYNVTGFNARYIYSERPDYNAYTNGNLDDAAQFVGSLMLQSTHNTAPGFCPDKGRNFIIAHSQGGLVTRALMHSSIVELNFSPQTRGFGGVVTVSSSLQGAMILNNQTQILQFASDACTKIAKAELEELGDNVPAIGFANTILDLLGKQHTIVNGACNITSFSLLPILFKDRLSPITTDYHVGANTLNTYNSDVNNTNYQAMPKVAFYGIEPRENIFWRTMNWMTKNPNEEDPWQANDDYAFYNTTIKPKVLDYNFKYVWNKHLYDDIYTPRWLHLIDSNNARRKYLAYEEAYNFLCNANSGWMSIIGALEVEMTGTWPPEFEITLKDSDGVVLKESAINLPGATHPPVKLEGRLENGQMTGSSHMQVRNDWALKTNLQRLYDGDYGLFFKTEQK